MNKIYSVIIKGKTLESRDLKELLARAVVQKRNLDRKSMLQNLSRGHSSSINPSGPYAAVSNAG